MLISITSRIQPCIQIQNLFFQIDFTEFSPHPYMSLAPPKSACPSSNRNSKDAGVISVERRIQPHVQIENLFLKCDLDMSHVDL